MLILKCFKVRITYFRDTSVIADKTDQASEKNSSNLCVIVLCLCVISHNMQTPDPTEFCLYTEEGRNWDHFYFNTHFSSFPQGIFISDASVFSESVSLLRGEKKIHLGEVEIPHWISHDSFSGQGIFKWVQRKDEYFAFYCLMLHISKIIQISKMCFQ